MSDSAVQGHLFLSATVKTNAKKNAKLFLFLLFCIAILSKTPIKGLFTTLRLVANKKLANWMIYSIAQQVAFMLKLLAITGRG